MGGCLLGPGMVEAGLLPGFLGIRKHQGPQQYLMCYPHAHSAPWLGKMMVGGIYTFINMSSKRFLPCTQAL